MMDKRRGKTAVLLLKKSGPELPELLNQFSVGIAGAGLALLFSIICRVACGRVSFCASKLFSTSVGLGLVWLSWAVSKLKDTVVYISKHASKLGLKDEEIMGIVNESFRDIYFRAVTVMAVAVLRLVWASSDGSCETWWHGNAYYFSKIRLGEDWNCKCCSKW